ncbi:1029_t:CDS:10 [Entrophospora sp. SA101]|nr:1029_t:CDS:10 [Entrophospora sp. SA101]
MGHQSVSRKFSVLPFRTKTQNFCQNEYNVTGFCSRQSCPLANSQYATVREINGEEVKIKRSAEAAAHLDHAIEKELIGRLKNKAYGDTPLNVNEKVWRSVLEGDSESELEDLEDLLQEEDEDEFDNGDDSEDSQELEEYEEEIVEENNLKNKRKNKITTFKQNKKSCAAYVEVEYEQLKLKDRLVDVAEAAAHLDHAIEKELIGRLKNKAYGDTPLNVNEKVWRSVLEGDSESELADLEDLLQEEDEDEFDNDDDSEDSQELEEYEEEIVEENNLKNKRKNKITTFKQNKKSCAAYVEVEYEHEH